MQNSKHAFTLVELLVVVLIIGVLSAIAIPMYQGAIDKSRWSTLLAPAKALQTAQTAAYMENGAYAEDTSALVLSLPGEAQDNKYIMPDAEYNIDTKTASQSTITGQLDTLPNVRLSMALKNPDSYLFCEAKSGDARAERLCKNLLAGQKAGSKNGYDKYLLDYPGPCAWANTTGQCYVSEEARCTAMGMPYANGMCGYKNDWTNPIINEGGICEATDGGCRSVKVYDGGICKSDAGYCSCSYAKIYNGGVCEANPGSGTAPCVYATIYEGGACVANRSDGCIGTTIDGGKCIANVPGACSADSSFLPVTYKNGGFVKIMEKDIVPHLRLNVNLAKIPQLCIGGVLLGRFYL